MALERNIDVNVTIRGKDQLSPVLDKAGQKANALDKKMGADKPPAFLPPATPPPFVAPEAESTGSGRRDRRAAGRGLGRLSTGFEGLGSVIGDEFGAIFGKTAGKAIGKAVGFGGAAFGGFMGGKLGSDLGRSLGGDNAAGDVMGVMGGTLGGAGAGFLAGGPIGALIGGTMGFLKSSIEALIAPTDRWRRATFELKGTLEAVADVSKATAEKLMTAETRRMDLAAGGAASAESLSAGSRDMGTMGFRIAGRSGLLDASRFVGTEGTTAPLFREFGGAAAKFAADLEKMPERFLRDMAPAGTSPDAKKPELIKAIVEEGLARHPEMGDVMSRAASLPMAERAGFLGAEARRLEAMKPLIEAHGSATEKAAFTTFIEELKKASTEGISGFTRAKDIAVKTGDTMSLRDALFEDAVGRMRPEVIAAEATAAGVGELTSIVTGMRAALAELVSRSRERV